MDHMELKAASPSQPVAIRSEPQKTNDDYQSLFTLETAGKLLTECGMTVPVGKYERVLHIAANVPEPILRSFIQFQADSLLQLYNEKRLSSPSHIGMLKKMLIFLNHNNPKFRMPAITAPKPTTKKPRVEDEDKITDDDDDDEVAAVDDDEVEMVEESAATPAAAAPAPPADKFKSGDRVTWMRGRDRLFGIVDRTVSPARVRVNIVTCVSLKAVVAGSIYFFSEPIWDGHKMMGNVDTRVLSVMSDMTTYAHLLI